MCSIGTPLPKSPGKKTELPARDKKAAPAGTRVASPVKKIPGTVSIKKTAKDDQQEQQKQESKQEVEAKDQPAETFTQDDLEKAWLLYTESIAKNSPNLYSTLTKRKPRLKEESLVVLEIDNKVQDREIREKRAEIHEFLRKELSNYTLHLETIIPENHEQSKAYFPEEIYQKMAEKNPNIKKLKDQLDMEIDY
jgi:DNA polymerase-3 subunit gamma/tau